MCVIKYLAVAETTIVVKSIICLLNDISFDEMIDKVDSVFRKKAANYDITNVLNRVKTTEMEGENYKITLNDGTICRYSKNKLLHCDDDYAVITPNGDKFSLVNGKLHCLCHNGKVLPSLIYKSDNGDYTMYHHNGYLHSYNDIPAVELSGIVKIWFNRGVVHRFCSLPVDYDSPNAAVEHVNFKAWLEDGVMIDGYLKPT